MGPIWGTAGSPNSFSVRMYILRLGFISLMNAWSTSTKFASSPLLAPIVSCISNERCFPVCVVYVIHCIQVIITEGDESCIVFFVGSSDVFKGYDQLSTEMTQSCLSISDSLTSSNRFRSHTTRISSPFHSVIMGFRIVGSCVLAHPRGRHRRSYCRFAYLVGSMLTANPRPGTLLFLVLLG